MFVRCPSHIVGSTATDLFSEQLCEDSDISSEEGEKSKDSSERCHGPFCHLQPVVLDYKQFKAARTIQRHVRGFLARRRLNYQNQAATTISKLWRGYYVRRFQFAHIQNLLHMRIMQYHNDMATKIQALFRGWMTRQNFQDFEGMKSLRMQYAEDMLSALFRKLCTMRKDHLLPGIYALRESDLLSKIEDLSATFDYRFHNGRVRAAIAKKRAFINDRREEFQGAHSYSMAPYPGPNSENIPYSDITLPKKIGPRLQRTILVYDKSVRDRHVKKVYDLNSKRRRKSMNALRENMRNLFCKDFIRRIVAHKKVKRFDTKMIQVFLDDLLTAAEDFNCFCKPKTAIDSLCE
ncbi:uncharacterized protein LOC108138217 [Drosophila elegans]|uniref:uncharacterized protein LOC108138217 n=1 Tax=Drosophila elegans TaxID=30023 RepID=UPI0007E843B5|nr:uncharacterized protein LOC108138217 [Drosophila elegans]